ncbi:SusC/RagA family TonB-linked outer membrane protein [Dinghuibacter silviterrae]|uniref:TonB-linked SusC/RagA family outer membrane protein n=1 Tax=Dinghuibacter silviterrae TaxID=1539049 RepID=A0A4V3GLD5_9BACT|nr:SusC/RagA family TonB-linked outer membrane protein [Dinghuibacter silviterrae]TDW99202.1 TonB-linked SusC/RagA family outer membrane protein [Dinghuibacter silviterrae]
MRKSSAPPGKRPGWGGIVLFSLFCIYALSARGSQGQADIRITLNHQPAEKAFRLIEKQTRLTFHFDKTEINPGQVVTLHFDKAPLSTVLEALSRQTGWVFQQRGDKILVLGKDTPLPPEELSVLPPGIVKGRVTDVSGTPLQGVTIQIQGTMTGVQTDADGRFSINVASGTTLIVTYVGYETQEVKVTGADLALVMKDIHKVLNEVVVTALGIKRQAKELGYSTARVGNAELNETKQTNLATELSGKVSGLQINTIDNSVNPTTRLVLRGNRSFLGNNQALLIVDGVPVDLNYINYINPNDVDNVTVLKGANAAALYGSDASNGVLIINTKKGSQGKPSITVSSTITQERVAYLPELQNEFGPHAGEYQQGYALFTDYNGNRLYIPFEQQAQGPAFNGDTVLIGFPQRDGSVLTGPYKAYPHAKYDFFNKGYTWQNDISYSSGDDKGSFYLSVQDVNTKGIVPDDQSRRTGFRFNGNRTYGKFTATIGLAYNQFQVSQDGDWADTYFSVMGFPPNIDLPAFKDVNNYVDASINGFPIPYSLNPYWYINNSRDNVTSHNLVSNADLTYRVTPWLTATYRVGMNLFVGDGKLTTADKSYSNDAILYNNLSFSGDNYVAFPPAPPAVTDSFGIRTNLNTTTMVSADKTFGDFSGKLILGYTTNSAYERTSIQSSSSLAFAGFYNIGSGTQSPLVGDYRQTIRTTGAFADLTLGYKEYLFIHGSVRRDQSSLLAEQFRTFYYPGVDAAFIPTEALPWLKDNKILSFAKLRASFTKVGNINIPPYSLANTYVLSTTPNNGFPFTSTGTTSYAINQTIYNPLLKPEFTTAREVGAELGFLRNRVNVQVAYYNEKTTNQTVPVQVSPVSGYNIQYINVGEMNSKGFEADLNLTPLVRFGSFRWNAGANLSVVTNRVVSLLPGTSELNIGTSSGAKGTVTNDYAIVGQAYPYLKVIDWARDPQGHVIVDPVTGLPSQDPNPRPFGQLNPTTTLGLNTSFQYKGFTLSAVAEFRTGNVVFNNEPYIDEFGLTPRSAASGHQRFVYPNSVIETAPGKYVPNTTTTINDIFLFWGQNGFAYLPPSMFVSSAAFWKVREISLAYDIPASVLHKARVIRKATVTLVGRNLFTWRPKDNIWTDPEFNDDNSNAVGQNSTSQPPPVRSFGANLTLVF